MELLVMCPCPVCTTAAIVGLVIFKDGEEALRFQADLSFKMVATKEEVIQAIDELLMSDF